jgi:excinuclease ABC subunit C
VKTRLGLPRAPRRFECIDVSHTSGKETVAAIVAFRDGEPDRKRYRSFHIRSVSGGDDYGAMREALVRRFKRGKANEAGWDLPDMLVVDGGKGQLAIALSALEEIGIADLPIVALAKEKENLRGDTLVDRVYVPGRKNPVELRGAGSGMLLLAQARDEAHRVSNALRLRLGRGERLKSGLDEVPGIGKKTRVLLLRAAGSFEALSAASAEQLTAWGASAKQARAIIEHLHRSEPEAEASEELALENAFAVEDATPEDATPEDATSANATPENTALRQV